MRFWHKNILIARRVSAVFVTSTALQGHDMIAAALMSPFQKRIVLFLKRRSTREGSGIFEFTDSWLIRLWIQCCPWTSGTGSLSTHKTDFSSWVGDLSWSPDRLTLGLEVPVPHFTQRCVLTFSELDKVLCILKYSAKTRDIQTHRDGDTVNHSWWGLMTRCHCVHVKANLNYWRHLSSKINCNGQPWEIPLLHNTAQGESLTEFQLFLWNGMEDMWFYNNCSLYRCEYTAAADNEGRSECLDSVVHRNSRFWYSLALKKFGVTLSLTYESPLDLKGQCQGTHFTLTHTMRMHKWNGFLSHLKQKFNICNSFKLYNSNLNIIYTNP